MSQGQKLLWPSSGINFVESQPMSLSWNTDHLLISCEASGVIYFSDPSSHL